MTAPVLLQEAPFERLLKSFKDELTDEEQKTCEMTTLRDLQTTIAKIQAKQVATRTTRNLRRIEGFLEGMENNAKIVDMFLNVHPFVAFIWGPMRLLLQMASTSANAFNALLDAYQRIGEHMPLFKQYQDVFENNPDMLHVLQLNVEDILEFHSEALKFFRRSIWRQTFDALWKQFDTKIGRILNNMQQHKGLLERQANLVEFDLAKQHRLLMKSRSDKLEEEAILSRKTYLHTWLSAPDVRFDQERGQETRADYPDSGRWLLAKTRFRTWFDLNSPSDPLLWIHGMPGSGKTVLASLIIDETRPIVASKTLYFYFRSSDPQKQSLLGFARSLLAQLLRLDDTKVSDLYDSVIADGDSTLNTRKLAESLLDSSLKDLRRTYIILDGLDECPHHEQKSIVSWVRKFVDSPASALEPNRCVFLSQHESSTKSLLSLIPTLAILPSDNAADIETYCRSWKNTFKSRFRGMTDEEFANIAETTSTSARGMFLFAKLVMNNLSKQTNLLRLRSEMGKDLYPKELDEAYLRIQNRILDDLRPVREDASQLLAWIICAIRPLKWREIQGAVAIDMENECIDLLNGSWSDDHVELCGPLVEEQPDGTLELVHATARSYLIRNAVIVPQIEHVRLASRSLEYLRLPAFQSNLNENEREAYILDGTYSFMDYAFINWPRHLTAAFTESIEDSQVDEFATAIDHLIESLDLFFECRWRTPKRKPKVPNAVIECMRRIEVPEDVGVADLREKLMLTLASMHRLTSPDIHDNSAISTLQIHETVPGIRTRIENMAFQENPESKLTEFYGESTAKCPKMYCDWFHEGFESTAARENHVNKHERPFLCPYAGCSYAKMGCTTAKELEAHTAAYHNEEPDDDEFPESDETEAEEFVFLNTESQIPAQDLNQAANPDSEPIRSSKGEHSPTRTPTGRTKRRPIIHQCKLCPRKFTRAYNLQSHMRTHTGEKPYACGLCNKAFSRSHDLKTHEDLHGGERKFTCRGTSTSGDVWGCGKKFARASALQRHFRSDIGRDCRKPLVDGQGSGIEVQDQNDEGLDAESMLARAGPQIESEIDHTIE